MYHKIITERSSFFRKAALSELKGNWIKAVAAVAILNIIMGIIDFIVNLFTNNPSTQAIAGVYYWIVFGAVLVGTAAFFMNMVRRNDPKLSDCFEGFAGFGRSFVLGALMLIFIILWSLLFIIPGIIAAYRYALAPMILRDRPELSPLECISESKRLMVGNKGSLFCLHFSFIGWALLASIPMAIVSGVLEMNGVNVSGNLRVILITISTVPLLWVIAYMETACVVFYEEIIRPEFNQYSGQNYGGNSEGVKYSYQRYEPDEDNEEKNNSNEEVNNDSGEEKKEL